MTLTINIDQMRSEIETHIAADAVRGEDEILRQRDALLHLIREA